jgi:hypothetical protein
MMYKDITKQKTLCQMSEANMRTYAICIHINVIARFVRNGYTS